MVCVDLSEERLDESKEMSHACLRQECSRQTEHSVQSLKEECFGSWLDGSEHSTYNGARPLIYVSYFIEFARN